MKSVGQGTIEYLVIMAIIIVIGLLFVGVTSSFLNTGSGISGSINKLKISSGVISVSDLVVDGDGDAVIGLTNNSGETLVITSVLVGGRDTNYNNTFPNGNESWFSLLDLSGYCDCVTVGVSQSCSVTVEYNTVNGISQSFTREILVDCENDVSPSGNTIRPYDDVAPSVALLLPVNNGQSLIEGVDFTFSASDNVELARCDFYLDGVYDQNITSFSSYQFSDNFTEDKLHEWNVYCVDTSGNGGWSETYTLDIDTNTSEITTCLELEGITAGSSYILMNDINCSGTSTWDSGSGFTPISFGTGNFDGNYHVISGLYIYRPVTSSVGLFGDWTGSSASIIKNFGIIDANITGQDYVGGIAGSFNRAGPDKVFFKGTITGRDYVGGITGQQGEEVAATNCYIDANIYGRNYVGGISGNYSVSSTKCYSSGNIDAGDYLSGLGWNMGWPGIQDSFSTMIVNGTGSNIAGAVGSGSPTNVYYSGTPEAGEGTYVATESDLYSPLHAVYTSGEEWDFVNTWTSDGLSLPKFSWDPR